MENSGASVLLASERFAAKGREVLHGMEGVAFDVIGSGTRAAAGASTPGLEDVKDIRGGMMLYTSGTTNRPVCTPHLYNPKTQQSQAWPDHYRKVSYCPNPP